MLRQWVSGASRLLVILSSLVLTPSARADLPAGLRIDDGFTYFEANNKQTFEGGKPIGWWHPIASLRVLGEVPARSGFKLVLLKDGKELYSATTDGNVTPAQSNDALPTPQMTVVGWRKPAPLLDGDGTYDAQVYYIDGKTDEQHLARTYKLDVRKVDRVRGSVTKPEADAPIFYINRHGDTAAALLYLRGPETPSYTLKDTVGAGSYRNVELVYSYSPSLANSSPELGRLKVKVDGKPITMPEQNGVPQDKMDFGEEVSTYAAEHTDRLTEKYQRGTAYKDMILFKRRSVVLPLQWGDAPANRPRQAFINLKDHPGKWELTWLVEREPVRVWTFTVGPDGMPVPHPEQAAGLSLAPNAYLVETTIPAGGGAFDQRLSPDDAKAGAFYGRPWATDAGKAMAAAIPAKGKPFPVTSDKE